MAGRRIAETVNIKRIFHRDKFRLGLYYPHNSELTARFKAMNAMWSKTYGCWYIVDDENALEEVKNACKGLANANYKDINSMLSEASLNAYLDSKRKPLKHVAINKRNIAVYEERLKSEGYSKSTISTYSGAIKQLAISIGDRGLDSLSIDELRHYMASEIVDRGLSNSYHRQFVGALKLYYRDSALTDLTPIETLELPKQWKKLPTVLSQDEVVGLLAVTRNLKHRTALAVLYGCGLRVSELLNLKVSEIDFDRMQLRVSKGKGKKDRTVTLAENLVPLLKNYLGTYRPIKYLLNGQNDVQYSAESLRAVIRRSAKDAGITKTVTPHTLRHSYATHMLDNGVDLRHIQVLLGHSRPETTMIYTHVSQERLGQVESPLDKLVRDYRTQIKNT